MTKIVFHDECSPRNQNLKGTLIYTRKCVFSLKKFPSHDQLILPHCNIAWCHYYFSFATLMGKLVSSTVQRLIFWKIFSLMVPKHLSWSMLHFSTANQYQQSLFSQMTSHAWRCRSLFYNKSNHQNIRYAILDFWELSPTSIHSQD